MIATQVVAGALDFEQLHSCRNQSGGALQFIQRAERIARALHEQRRYFQIGKMRGAQLTRLPRRMQGIRKQQQTVNQARRFRRQHARLPAPIGMSTEPDLIGMLLTNLQDLLAQSFAISRGVTGTRRTVRAVLPIGQVVTDDLNLTLGECVCERDQQRRIAIGSSAVSEY